MIIENVQNTTLWRLTSRLCLKGKICFDNTKKGWDTTPLLHGKRIASPSYVALLHTCPPDTHTIRHLPLDPAKSVVLAELDDGQPPARRGLEGRKGGPLDVPFLETTEVMETRASREPRRQPTNRGQRTPRASELDGRNGEQLASEKAGAARLHAIQRRAQQIMREKTPSLSSCGISCSSGDGKARMHTRESEHTQPRNCSHTMHAPNRERTSPNECQRRPTLEGTPRREPLHPRK